MASADQSPCSYEYQIENIAAFRAAATGVEFKSPFFSLHGLKWALRIFPNGSVKSKQGNVNLFIWLRSLPPRFSKVAVNLTLSLKEAECASSFPHLMTRGWLTGTLYTCTHCS